MLNINDVFKFADSETEYRLIWYSKSQDIAYVISLAENKFPKKMKFSVLCDRQVNDELFLCEDPFLSKLVPEELLSEKERENRDIIWGKVGQLVENEPDIYDLHIRQVLMNNVVEKGGISKRSLCNYLVQYWQVGKKKNAFLWVI